MRKTTWLVWLLIACGADDDAVDTGGAGSSTAGESSSAATASDPSGDPGDSSGADELGESSSGIDATSGSADDGLSSSDDGVSSSDDGVSSSDDGDDTSTGEIPEDCVGIEMIELVDPYVMPIDADAWTPGGSVNVGVTMHNPGPDFLDYPSIIVESDDPLVTSESPGNQLFGILQDQSTELYVVFTADRAIASGTDVTFTIRMASLDQPCPNGATTQVDASVE